MTARLGESHNNNLKGARMISTGAGRTFAHSEGHTIPEMKTLRNQQFIRSGNHNGKF